MAARTFGLDARKAGQRTIAVLGSGYWGKNLVRNFAELGALAAVADPSETGRKTAKEIAPEVPVYESAYEAMRIPGLSGVAIATPAETHYRVASAALAEGLDVFVEKPLALTHEDGAQLVREAGRRRRILMVGHVLEYHPAVEQLRSLVNSGELGKVRYIYSNRLSLGKIRREENALWSFAPHDIAIILRLVGKTPFQVTATGGSYVTPNIADVTVTDLLFDNGIRAHIFVSWLHPFKEQRLVVIGDKKMASFDDVNKELILYDQRVDVQDGNPMPVKGEGRVVTFSRDEPLRLECQAFLEAIHSRRPPLTDGGSGLMVLSVLQAAQRSLMTNGEPVSLSRLEHSLT